MVASHYRQLLISLAQPKTLETGDNAAYWIFDLPNGPVTMDTPDAKPT